MTLIMFFSYGYARHKIYDRKNGPASEVILMAMWIRRFGAECIAQYGRSRATLGQVFAPYRPGGGHGHRFWHKKLSCGVAKSLFEASIQKAQNRPSTQLIKMTSCEERLNSMIKAEEHR